MDQVRARAGAVQRQRLPEGTCDRREAGKARRHPAGEIPDHRAALRKTARHDAAGIDRKRLRDIVENMADISELVAMMRPGEPG
jgi:hypothetical protein